MKDHDRQCHSCGGFCKPSGCERENAPPTNYCATCNASYKNTQERIIRCGTCFVRVNMPPTKYKELK